MQHQCLLFGLFFESVYLVRLGTFPRKFLVSLFESLHLVMHWSDSNDTKRTHGSADRSLRKRLLIARATHSDAHIFTPLERPRSTRRVRTPSSGIRDQIGAATGPPAELEREGKLYLAHPNFEPVTVIVNGGSRRLSLFFRIRISHDTLVRLS
jgi:hypothetical protein